MLDDLEIRYVAITATTDKTGRPEAHAITRGSVGEVVRVSGAAPGLFSPTVKNGHRYSDGTCALAIPARVPQGLRRGHRLRLQLDSRRHPAQGRSRRRLHGLGLPAKRPYGRVVDARMAASFLIERLSAEIADDAHCYIGSPAAENALESTMRYENAADVAKTETCPRGPAATEECVRRWKEFGEGAARDGAASPGRAPHSRPHRRHARRCPRANSVSTVDLVARLSVPTDAGVVISKTGIESRRFAGREHRRGARRPRAA